MTITVCKLVRFKSVSPKRLFTLLILFSCLSSLALFVLWQSAPAHAVVPPGQHQLETFRLLDLPSFGYRLSTGSCDNVTAMLLIVSHQGNIEQRAEIRRSYPADHLRSLGVGRVFLLGVASTLSDYASVSETQVTQEAAEHRDIVQSHLPESYRRLVYKHAMGLHWALRHCSPLSTRLLIKMDDDIVVDLYRLLARLSPLIPTPRSSLLAGWVHFNLEPVRQTDSKWFVSQRELPEESRYPPFLSGWLYAVSLRSASALLSALSRLTLDSPPFWIDDVFVTGRAAAAANLSLTSLNAFYATDWRYLACCLQQPRHHRCAFLVGPDAPRVAGAPRLMTQFAAHARHCWRTNCSRRTLTASEQRSCVFHSHLASLPNASGQASVEVVPLG